MSHSCQPNLFKERVCSSSNLDCGFSGKLAYLVIALYRAHSTPTATFKIYYRQKKRYAFAVFPPLCSMTASSSMNSFGAASLFERGSFRHSKRTK